MALRNQISEVTSEYKPPILGINLRSSLHDLRPGEAAKMQNCEFFGGTRIRRGSQRLNSASLGSFAGLAGHKYYHGGSNPTSKRLIAYNNRISVLNGVGVETVLTSSMTPGLNTYFATWPITDCAYVSNATDMLRKYDGTTFSTVVGSNIPIPRTAVVPILDRLLCITTNGIERTSPRTDNVWSSNSSWATLRPALPGLFTGLAPYALRGSDTITSGAIALQERAYYHISGTDYGTDASAATASVGEDVAIKLLDATVGTASPNSICTVPGVGMFWFTTDLNVFWLPEGTLIGRYVGDNLQSTNATAGLESTNRAALSKVWMTYHDNILMLGIPTGSNTYTSTQFWLDIRMLRDHPDKGPIWYGPMTGQTLNHAWLENQQGDNAIYGIEGNVTNGMFVYQLRVPAHFSDAVGLTDVPIEMVYHSMYKDFGVPSREKYVQAVHMDLNSYTGTATVDLVSLTETLASNVPIEAVV